MENQSLNSYIKSLTAGTSIVPEAFPNLIIRSCISEASESLNGPRYAAQDKNFSLVYEVRYNPVEVNDLDRSEYPNEEEEDGVQEDLHGRKSCWWTRQEERLRKLRLCARHHFPLVSFPQSIYLYANNTSTARTHPVVCSVEELCGLSLGDIVRSDWTLVQESVLNDVLETVEGFGKMTPVLPPHGNISADAIKQLLTVRETAVEMQHRSRWVVGDWLLTPPSEEHYDLMTTIADIEWMLTSTFSQLRIQRDASGTLLSASDLEARIGTMTSRLRDGLALRCGTSLSSACLRAGDALEDKEEVKKCLQIGVRGFNYNTQANTNSILEKTRFMTVKEKIVFHQNALRDEQQQLNRYRRKYAQLPPRPHPPSDEADYAIESQEYKPTDLGSPIIIKPSVFFGRSQGSRKGVSSGYGGASDGPIAEKYKDKKRKSKSGRRSEMGSSQSQKTKQLETPDNIREVVIDDIVELALMHEDQVFEMRKALEEESKLQRECVQSILMKVTSASSSRSRGGSGVNDFPLHSTSRGTNFREKASKPLFPPQLKNLFTFKTEGLYKGQVSSSSLLNTGRSTSSSRTPTVSRRRTLNSTLLVASRSTRSSSSGSTMSHMVSQSFDTSSTARISLSPREARINTARPQRTSRRLNRISGGWSTRDVSPGNSSVTSIAPKSVHTTSLPLFLSSMSTGRGAMSGGPTSVPLLSFTSSSKDPGPSTPGGSPYGKGLGNSSPQTILVQGRKDPGGGSTSHGGSPSLSSLSSSKPSSPKSPNARGPLSALLSHSGMPASSKESSTGVGGHNLTRASSSALLVSDELSLPFGESYSSFTPPSALRKGSIPSLRSSSRSSASPFASLPARLHPYSSAYSWSHVTSPHGTDYHHGRSRHVDPSLVENKDRGGSAIHVPKTIYVTRSHHHSRHPDDGPPNHAVCAERHHQPTTTNTTSDDAPDIGAPVGKEKKKNEPKS